MEIKEKIIEFVKNNKKKVIIFSGIFISFLFVSIFIFYNNKKYNDKNIENNEILSLEISEPISDKESKEEKVYVDIKGNVVNPGIYEVMSNARVNDVINASGGLLGNANTKFINLSKKVFDEMVIIIYSNEEILEFNKSKETEEKECICENTINDACTIENNISEENKSSLININTADIELLTSLPGIGEAKAKSIIKYRDEVGKFELIEDLMEVSGIGESVYSKVKDFITTK